MNILVIGSGGREHAICWKLRQSSRVRKLYCAPGNGGIAGVAECVDLAVTDIDGVVAFAKQNNIDLVMVAPEDPLAAGMVDALMAAGIRAFGPSAKAAIVESSKAFSKALMKKYGIPTAEYEVFDEPGAAIAYIRAKGAPIVVKADGLALGKGVVVAMTEEDAEGAVLSMMQDKKFGESGSSVVIEEFMTGPEVTVLAFTDGKTVAPMLSSQDHKRAFTGDLGPNTGGMGAFSPSPKYTDEIAKTCMDTIFIPTINALRAEGRPFKGVIYFGLMLTERGPRVVEYNARFGDPETQAVLSLLETDLLDIFEAVIDERLDTLDIKWRSGSACCVVLASGGYPEKYEKGFAISGLGNVPDDITVFHAGSALRDGQYVTNGGRILGVTALSDDVKAAAARAYEGVRCISFDKMQYRTDIGEK